MKWKDKLEACSGPGKEVEKHVSLQVKDFSKLINYVSKLLQDWVYVEEA